jgi:hypothetical protein
MSATVEQSAARNGQTSSSGRELPLKLELELVIDDKDVIQALVEFPEGDERNQYAAEALKVGVVALRHVGGMVTADMIQRECTKLIGDIQHTFTHHRQIVHERVDNCLKEYFDPNNGRFSERVNRLVSPKDGELSKLIAGLIDGETSLLARTLLAHVGRESPLMQILDPDHSSGLLASLKKIVEGELARQREHVLKEFSLDEPCSALNRLKTQLEQQLAKAEEKNQSFRQDVKVSLERMVVTRQESERSTRHGFQFQDAVCEFLGREAQHAGDIASPTANTTGLIKNCKIGDCVVELGPDSACPGAKIVVEAKEEIGYTLSRARQEIETARKNRDADWGLFVFSKKTAPAGLEPFARYGSDFVVVWDAEDVASDVYLKAGVIAARALCFRAQRQNAAQQVDFQVIDKAILEIEKRAGNLDDVRKSAETIHSSSEKILDRVRKDRDALEKQIEVLRQSVDDLKHSVATIA